MKHTITRASHFPFASRRRLFLLSTALIVSPVAGVSAQSLVPDMPSVELHLDALNTLRPMSANFPPPAPAAGTFAPVQAAPYVAPERSVPRDNAPQQPQPMPVAQPIPQQPVTPVSAGGMILPPPPAPVYATSAPVVQPQPVAQPVPVAQPRPVMPPVAAPKPAVRVPTEVVKPIAAPTSALPSFSGNAKPVSAPVAAPKPAPVPVVAPKPVPVVAPKPVAVVEPKPVPVAQPATPAPAPVIAPPAPMMDFSKAAADAKPAPVAKPAASDVDDMLKSLDAANNPVPSAAGNESFPTLSPLPEVPSVLPAPQGAKAAPSDVMIAEPAKPSAQMPVLAPAATKDDPALKNLSDRVNSLFVKEPEKQGIVSDRTSVTGQMNNMPPKPPVAPTAVPAPAPISNATPPKEGSVLDKLAQGAKVAPSIPSAVPVVVKPAAGVVEAKKNDALPELPALPPLASVPAAPPADTRGVLEKPKQLSLEEVNKKSPPATMSVPPKPIVVPQKTPAPVVSAPVVAPKIVVEKPVEKPAEKPLVIAPPSPIVMPVAEAPKEVVSAAKPSTAPVAALKPGTVAALPELPPMPGMGVDVAKPAPIAPLAPVAAKSTGGIASADSLADILPPPNGVKIPAAPAPMSAPVVAPLTPPSSLPKLPTLEDSRAAPSSLPSLSALTGESKSSMDIAMDKEGVRSASLEPLAPATLENTIPSMKKDESLPKITRGTPELPAAKTPALPAVPVKEAPSAAIATPDKPEPVQLASTSVPANPTDVKPGSVARAVALPADAGKPLLSVGFDKDKTDVELDMQSKIAGIAGEAKKGKVVWVVANASGPTDDQSMSKRISLSRGLQVRAKLIEKGVNGDNVKVRAVGYTGPGSKDSAEIFVE